MAAWVDDTSPDWRGEPARCLLAALKRAVTDRDDVEPIAQAMGLPLADLPSGGTTTAGEVWLAAVKEAAARPGTLRKLVVHMRDNFPVIAGDMKAILRADGSGRPALWYQARLPERARLLGPGARRAMIDRYPFGTSVISLVGAEAMPILSIKGEAGRGKSHSRYLLRHVIDMLKDEWRLITLIVEDEWPEVEETRVTCRELIGELSAKLELDRRYGDIGEYTEAKRIARELVNSFVGRFSTLPDKRRVLFIDGLDRANVADDVDVAIGHLALAVEKGELGATRLVITGYRGTFARDVLAVMIEDVLEPIGKSHLELFFEDIGEDMQCPLQRDEVDHLVEATLAKASFDDLAGLERVVAAEARKHFGGGS